MASKSQKAPAPFSKADRQWGYRIGVDGWSTFEEAALSLGCSTRTVERKIANGALRAMKTDTNGRVKICRRSIAEFIAQREVCKTA